VSGAGDHLEGTWTGGAVTAPLGFESTIADGRYGTVPLSLVVEPVEHEHGVHPGLRVADNVGVMRSTDHPSSFSECPRVASTAIAHQRIRLADEERSNTRARG